MALLPWFLFVFSSFLVLVLVKFIINRVGVSSPEQKQLPSTPTLPTVGNLHSLTHRSLSVLSKKHGPLVLVQRGGSPVVIVSSADIAREIFKENSLSFASRLPPGNSDNGLYGGLNILAELPYGDDWRKMRNACVSGMLSPKNVKSFVPNREHEVAGMIETISHSCTQSRPVNLTKMFFPSFYNVISKCITGRDSKQEEVVSFSELLELLLELLTQQGSAKSFFFGDYLPWLGWLDTRRNWSRVPRHLHAYIDQLIDQHLMHNSKQDDPDYKADFVDHLLHIQEDNNLTRHDLKSIIMEMFIGAGTVTGLMEWTMSELIKNPNVLKKAQEEVRRVVGTKSKVEDKDIQHMSYLKCILKETLRLYPTDTLLVRQSSVDTCLGGYNIPAGSVVMVNVWEIQRDVKYWDSPDEYIPERFYNNNNQVDFKGQHYEFIPFGSKQRSCPGIMFAMAYVELAIANLIYWFDWMLPEGTNSVDMDEHVGVGLRRKNPLLLVPVRLPSSSSDN